MAVGALLSGFLSAATAAAPVIGAGAAIAGGIQAQQASKAGKKAAKKTRREQAQIEAEANRETAEGVKKQRRQASILTRGFDVLEAPKLGKTGLLGLGQ